MSATGYPEENVLRDTNSIHRIKKTESKPASPISHSRVLQFKQPPSQAQTKPTIKCSKLAIALDTTALIFTKAPAVPYTIPGVL